MTASRLCSLGRPSRIPGLFLFRVAPRKALPPGAAGQAPRPAAYSEAMSLYPWVKALHLVFVASWFAGLFYLPRIFVNLAQVPSDSHAERERLLLMARKLYRFASFLRREAQWDQGGTEIARKRHSDSKQCHERRRDGHDVTEVAQTKVLAEALRACRSDRRDDLAPLVLDRLPLVHILVCAVLA